MSLIKESGLSEVLGHVLAHAVGWPIALVTALICVGVTLPRG